MTPAEVITADANERGIDPQQVLGAVAQLIQNKQGKLFNAGNSVLFVRLLSEDIGELHFFTEDSPIAIARYIKVFWNGLKKAGIKRVYGKADNQEILQLIQRAGADIQQPDLEGYNWMAEV
jgi:uncharacterized protein YgfB (UPF0149 family)